MNQICVLSAPRRPAVVVHAAAAPAVTGAGAAALVSQVAGYLQTQPAGLQTRVQPKQFGERVGLAAQSDIPAGQVRPRQAFVDLTCAGAKLSPSQACAP